MVDIFAYACICSNYSDLTRHHPKWWFSKGNPLISGKSRLVKYYNLARCIDICIFIIFDFLGIGPIPKISEGVGWKLLIENG